MPIFVFCNVGTRDVVHGPEDPKTWPKARLHGQELLDQQDIVAGDLRFPILKPALDYILRQVNGRLDHVFFIGTNQKNPEYRHNDTLYYAQLAAKVLAPRYGDQIGQITVVEVGQEPPINPSLYDEAFEVYGRLLESHSQGTTTCYVVPVGGIPACNTALLWHGVRLFREQCHPIFVTEKEHHPYPLRAASQIIAFLQETSVLELLSRFDFAGAVPLLAAYRRRDDPLLHLMQYATARLSFDFPTAQTHLKLALQSARGEMRQQINEKFQDVLQPLLTKDPLALIGEVYYNALVAWENGRYVDFLGRAIRFQEAVWHYLPAKLPPTNKLLSFFTAENLAKAEMRKFLLDRLEELADEEQPRPGTTKMVRIREVMTEKFNLSDLANLCFDLGISDEEIPGDTPSVKVRELLDYSLRQGRWPALVERVKQLRPYLAETLGEDHGPLQTLAQILGRLERLVDLCQDSIIAHGYGGVSADILLQAYNGDNDLKDSPIQDMFVVCHLLGVAVASPFIEVRDFITARLREPHA